MNRLFFSLAAVLIFTASAFAGTPFERVEFPGRSTQAVLSGPMKATAGAQSIKILLEYASDTEELRVLEFSESHKHPPKTRKPTLEHADFVFQCEDSQGKVIGNFPIYNPNLLRHDHVHYEQGPKQGHFEGHEFEQEVVQFEVVIPYVEHLANLRILKVQRDHHGHPVALDSVGASPVKDHKIGIDKNITGIAP